MQKDVTKILVESTVRRTIKEIKESPERATRNLIDLALNFSTGRFQRHFFKTAQKMLHNQKSAYYTLVKQVIDQVDAQTLISFGINLGYNECTKGAKVIREIEAEKHFDIPWALNLEPEKKKDTECPSFYMSVIEQGVSLGIHTYLLFAKEIPYRALEYAKSFSECAFILFLTNEQITDDYIEKLKEMKNVMISVRADDGFLDTCQKLREAHILYSVHYPYKEKDKNWILNGNWLEAILPAKPAFAFLLSEAGCSHDVEQEIYQYVLSVRDGQEYPIILMDVKQDSLAIDRVISDGECLAGFDRHGRLRTHKGILASDEFNIYLHPLETILQKFACR